MIETKRCSACAAVKSNATPPKEWKKIGEEVETEMSVGSGHSREEYSFYQCSVCGSLWEHMSESGAGGHYRGLKSLKRF